MLMLLNSYLLTGAETGFGHFKSPLLLKESKLEGSEERNKTLRGRRVQCEYFMSLDTTDKL